DGLSCGPGATAIPIFRRAQCAAAVCVDGAADSMGKHINSFVIGRLLFLDEKERIQIPLGVDGSGHERTRMAVAVPKCPANAAAYIWSWTRLCRRGLLSRPMDVDVRSQWHYGRIPWHRPQLSALRLDGADAQHATELPLDGLPHPNRAAGGDMAPSAGLD